MSVVATLLVALISNFGKVIVLVPKSGKLLLINLAPILFFSACSPQYALDLSGSGTSNGTNIQLWESNNTISQRWQIAAPDYLENGIYTIGALDDKNKVIDISYGLFFNGTNIQLWEKQ